jgi:hypothetical protein
MSHRINAFPIGRTANQMFQIAALMGYAKKHKCEWGFPSDTREVPHLRKMFPNIPVLDGNFRRANYADPSQFNYEPLPDFGRDTTLVGFFQSEKYFEAADDQIRQMFKLDINPVDAVSIHVRRGDYVQHSNSFPPINEEYIALAIGKLMNNGYMNAGDKVIFFSDDIEWCKRQFKNPRIEYSEGRNEFEDLSLMASCKHHIIANSSFSWWGAWLGHNPDKRIVSPSFLNWFGPGFTGSPPKDLIPYNWHQIKFR